MKYKNNKYAELLNTIIKKAAYKSWDPNFLSFKNTIFALGTSKLDSNLLQLLKKHYARLLAKAYKLSTGKNLANPLKHIDPRYGYIIGRAANVKPEILEKLNDFYFNRLGGWSTTYKNITPGLAMDAVDAANNIKAMYPYDYLRLGLDKNKEYVPSKRIKAEFV